ADGAGDGMQRARGAACVSRRPDRLGPALRLWTVGPAGQRRVCTRGQRALPAGGGLSAVARASVMLPVVWRPQVDTIYPFDALAFLRQMETGSVNCIVTSPPYYGLRDYQVAGQIGL